MWLAVAVSVGVVIIGGVLGFRAWLLQAPSPVTVSEAVDRYRAASSDPAASSSMPVATAPLPGVYVYATQGQETVDALGGDTHVYPPTTTITVTAIDCGGFRIEWRPVSGRADTTEICPSGGGLVERGAVNAHEFFQMSQAENFMCAPGAWWLPPATVTTWTAECQSDGGRTTSRAGRVLGPEAVTIASETHDAVHVRFDDTVTGTSTGTSTTDLWLDPHTGLPLRQTSTSSTGNETVIGHVTFDEHVDMTLQSTTPQT